MTFENLLLEKYSTIFHKEKNPDWAVIKKSNSTEIVHPPIPFIGNNYNDLKILLYASVSLLRIQQISL